MRYLAVHWNSADRQASVLAEAAIRQVQAFTGWSFSAQVPGLALVAPRERRARILPWGRSGFICGEIYRSTDGAAAPPPPPEGAGGLEPFGRLVRSGFGRYVAVLGGTDAGVFRDPSGGVDAMAWRVGPLGLVAADFGDAPPPLRPPRLRLDWTAIARAMAAASTSVADLGFRGVSGLAPGAHRFLAEPEHGETLLWSPAAFAARRPAASEARLLEALRDRVEVAVKALVGSRERIAVEVSGGLDSAIVATTLARLGLADRVTSWLNYHSSRPEGDERPWARSVTAAAGARLDAVRLAVRPLVEADFKELAASPRPPVNALLPHLDRDVTCRLAAEGAMALVSGQGGDAAFFQMPTPLVLTDELARRGPAALFGPALLDVAGMLRRSVWRVAADALRPREPASQSPRSVAALMKASARLSHPWVRDAAGLPPAKRLQVAGLANAHVATGARRLTAVADLLYPLCAQPVVELCLSIPAVTLQRGGRERALARAAFADRLPARVLDRRKKGELTAFHAQTVAASLDFLRPHLLDGCLAQAGVIDRRRLEAALRRDHLLRYAGGGEILLAAALEAWVRRWQGYAPDFEPATREQVARSLAR
jgi:asparagine synthase (glutamine-hydrolysing)